MKKKYDIEKIARGEIVESMKRVIRAEGDGVLAEYLGMTKQAILNYKSRGAISFYEKIFEFCVKHKISISWPVKDDMGEICMVEAGFKHIPASEVVREPALPYNIAPEEQMYLNMALDVLRGVNEQDKNLLIMSITSCHQHYKERRGIDEKCLENLKKNIQKQEEGICDIKKAESC